MHAGEGHEPLTTCLQAKPSSTAVRLVVRTRPAQQTCLTGRFRGGVPAGPCNLPLDDDDLVLDCRRRKAGVELGVHGGQLVAGTGWNALDVNGPQPYVLPPHVQRLKCQSHPGFPHERSLNAQQSPGPRPFPLLECLPNLRA